MKFLLVVFFLIDGAWIEGEASKGWGPYPYESENACLAGKLRADNIYANLKAINPRAIEKRYKCVAEPADNNN